jgi:Domain of unknown function (DUF4157)
VFDALRSQHPKTDSTQRTPQQVAVQTRHPVHSRTDVTRLPFYTQIGSDLPPAWLRLSTPQNVSTEQSVPQQRDDQRSADGTSQRMNDPAPMPEMVPTRQMIAAPLPLYMQAWGDQPLLRGCLPVAPHAPHEGELLQGKDEPAPRKKNTTGLPDPLKAGIETLAGISLDDVQVHYHSPKPAHVQALAYTEGTEIHMGPGQEQHLAHEAWHVVQQKQGRVHPTRHVKGMPVNDEPVLEHEAHVMGTKARQQGSSVLAVDDQAHPLSSPSPQGSVSALTTRSPSRDGAAVSHGQHPVQPTIQRLIGLEMEADVPLWASPSDQSPIAVIGAFLAGNVQTKEEIKKYTQKHPYSITTDSSGVSTIVDEVYEQWLDKIDSSSPQLKKYFKRTAKTQRLEFVTEPYSENQDKFTDDKGQERGRLQFLLDLKEVVGDIGAYLEEGRKRSRSILSGSRQIGLPEMDQWIDAILVLLGKESTPEELKALVRESHGAIQKAMTDTVYIQANIGILPEKIVAFQAYQRTKEGLSYPLAASHQKSQTQFKEFAMRQSDAGNRKAALGTMVTILLYSALELSASEFAELVTPGYTKDSSAVAQAAFAGYIQTLSMMLGGQIIFLAREQASGKRSGVTAKSIVNLLPKTPLHQIQNQLPDQINPAIWWKEDDPRYRALVDNLIVWAHSFKEGCADLAAEGENKPLADTFDAFTLEANGLLDWMIDVLAGKEDSFAKKAIGESVLPLETPERGGRVGAQLGTEKRRTLAIPFETRFPSRNLQLENVETYAKEVMNALNEVHGER